MRPAEILVADRFPALRFHLLALLDGLSAEDWTRPTAAPLWCVKDIAAHLLGGDIGVLSRCRDAYRPSDKPVEDLVALINGLNREWIGAAQRMSPRLLCELLAFTGPLVETYFASLDPFAMGDPVSWAGPEPAPVWFDVAREFTERWHHQQQIRDATGAPPLYDSYFFAPVLDTFVRALPHNFRRTSAPDGTAVRLEITGHAGGVWYVVRTDDSWFLTRECTVEPAAAVELPQDSAWRLFTKGLDESRARHSAAVQGDPALVLPIFRTISIIG
jgi:uncharacterized protein (TIGR03083 family)